MSNQKNNNGYILGITVVAAIAGLLFGYDTGVIGGSQLYFTEYFEFTKYEQGWAVSSALLGCFFGAILAGYISQKYSRKYTLIFSAVLFSISAWGSGIPESLDVLVIFRIIGGLGVGIASMTAPMYIAEIAPPKQRGKLVSYYQLAIVIGFFVVFVATYLIGGGDISTISAAEVERIHDYNVNKGWRVMFWSELVPALSFLILLFALPHSPRWLMMKSRDEEALKVLNKLSASEEEANEEFNEIKASFHRDDKKIDISIFAKGLGFVLFLGIMLSVLQQVTGINAILYYGAEIFSNVLGYGPEDALKQQMLLGGVNLIFTFIAIYTVDSWGRKPLLITGTLGMFLGIGTLAYTIYIGQLGVVSLIGMLTFVGSFALSMGPIVWVMLTEIFPNTVRSKMLAIAVAAQWLFNFFVGFSFPIVTAIEVNEQSFSGVNLIFTFIAIYTVDSWGRKPLLITGTLGMFLGIGTLAYTIYIGQLGVVSLIGMLTFVGSFALSMGPIVWVMLTEIFPNTVRSKMLAIAVAAQWLFNFFVGFSFPIVTASEVNEQSFNGSLPYFIFAVLCLVTVVFVWRFIPETKGKSLEELEDMWK